MSLTRRPLSNSGQQGCITFGRRLSGSFYNRLTGTAGCAGLSLSFGMNDCNVQRTHALPHRSAEIDCRPQCVGEANSMRRGGRRQHRKSTEAASCGRGVYAQPKVPPDQYVGDFDEIPMGLPGSAPCGPRTCCCCLNAGEFETISRREEPSRAPCCPRPRPKNNNASQGEVLILTRCICSLFLVTPGFGLGHARVDDASRTKLTSGPTWAGRKCGMFKRV